MKEIPKKPVSVEQAFARLKEIGARNNCAWELGRWQGDWLDVHILEHHEKEKALSVQLAEAKAREEALTLAANQFLGAYLTNDPKVGFLSFQLTAVLGKFKKERSDER